jgi:hypothetical protein
MHSPAYTCIHAHFGDFTFTQLRSVLLISLQLRLQLEKEVPSASPQAFERLVFPAPKSAVEHSAQSANGEGRRRIQKGTERTLP